MGVRGFEFDINTGIGTVTFAEGVVVDLAAVEKATTGAGFELEWVEIEVVGPVSRTSVDGAEVLAVFLRGRSQKVLILPGAGEVAGAKFAELARGVDEAGKMLRIRGRAHARRGGRMAMTIEVFEFVEDRNY